VLLHAGWGPTDRDGNTPILPGKNDALKQIALALSARGIASVRYDKRGIAASRAAGPSEADLRFDAYIDDAVAWVKKLRADKRFGRVTIAGHSEGSLIGMVAAARAPADGFVSLEGAGRNAAVVLREQFDRSPQTPADLRASAAHIIDELAAGRTVADVPAPLAPLFHASVQPYLISWFKYDPAHVQVTLTDAQRLHTALPSASYVVVQGMNHVLKYAPDTSDAALVAGYTNPALPVEPKVIDAIYATAR
jgi:pimeloyl-ACP methyl ester carboxylesterase